MEPHEDLERTQLLCVSSHRNILDVKSKVTNLRVMVVTSAGCRMQPLLSCADGGLCWCSGAGRLVWAMQASVSNGWVEKVELEDSLAFWYSL